MNGDALVDEHFAFYGTTLTAGVAAFIGLIVGLAIYALGVAAAVAATLTDGRQGKVLLRP